MLFYKCYFLSAECFQCLECDGVGNRCSNSTEGHVKNCGPGITSCVKIVCKSQDISGWQRKCGLSSGNVSDRCHRVVIWNTVNSWSSNSIFWLSNYRLKKKSEANHKEAYKENIEHQFVWYFHFNSRGSEKRLPRKVV